MYTCINTLRAGGYIVFIGFNRFFNHRYQMWVYKYIYILIDERKKHSNQPYSPTHKKNNRTSTNSPPWPSQSFCFKISPVPRVPRLFGIHQQPIEGRRQAPAAAVALIVQDFDGLDSEVSRWLWALGICRDHFGRNLWENVGLNGWKWGWFFWNI